MFTIDLNGQIQFDYRNEFSLLDTIEQYDANVNFSCRGGFCGACKVKLIEGQVKYLTDPLYTCSKGEVLSCCCIPNTNLKLAY